MKNYKIISLWAKTFLWCGLIFFLSSIPGLKTELGVWDLVLRKIAHLTEYAVLFLLFRKAAKETFNSLNQKGINILSVLFCFLYAVSDEFHQSFVPGRGPAVLDVGIDVLGAIIGFSIYLHFTKVNHREKYGASAKLDY